MQYFLNLEQSRSITAFANTAFNSGFNKGLNDGRTEVLKTIQAQAYLAGYVQSQFDVESKVNASIEGAGATQRGVGAAVDATKTATVA